MLISLFPDEILDLTFKQLAPAFRSDALSEVYVFDTPVDLLPLRLVSKRFCRIATPLAWRRVQLKISKEDVAKLSTMQGRTTWSWNAPTASTCRQGSGTSLSPTQFRDFPAEGPFNRTSSESSILPSNLNSNGRQSFHLNSSMSHPLSFFQAHPELAAHVRVLSLIINVEHHIEKSGSGSGSQSQSQSDSGSGSGFGEFASGLTSASPTTSTLTLPYNDENESDLESGFQLGNHNNQRDNINDTIPLSSSLLSTSSQRFLSSTYRNPTRHLEYVFRATTEGMIGLRTVFVWDAATSIDTSFPSRDRTAETLAREVLSLFHRSRLIKVLSLKDVDGASFATDLGCQTDDNDYHGSTVSGFDSLTRRHGLKMLHLSNTRHPARIISSLATTGTLEVLSLEVARSTNDNDPANSNNANSSPVPTLGDLPWSTLKEVSLLHCTNDKDWCHFLSGFRLHQSQSTLTELLVGELSGLDHPSPYPSLSPYNNRLTHLLTTFQTQPLTKLTLYALPHLTPFTASRIVRAFPNLRNLTLLTENELGPWHGGVLDDYARIFGTLPYLETLGWNNSHLLGQFCYPMPESARECSYGLGRVKTTASQSQSLEDLYARPINALMRRAKRLRCVRFISAVDCVVDSVFITTIKESKGCFRHECDDRDYDYDSQFDVMPNPPSGVNPTNQRLSLTVKRSNIAALHTSSWDTTSVQFDDII